MSTMSRILLQLLLFWAVAFTLQPSSFTADAQIPLPPKLCENIDLSAFCVIDNHFSHMVLDEWARVITDSAGKATGSDEDSRVQKYYKQHETIVQNIFNKQPWKENENDVGYLRPEDRTTPAPAAAAAAAAGSTTTTDPPKPPIVVVPKVDVSAARTDSVFSVLDMCDMEKVLYTGPFPGQGKVNPFQLKVFQIEVEDKRLHNHLHLEITGGNFYYAFVVVNDQDGWAVGDFNTGIPCGLHELSGCCINGTGGCYHAETKDTIPCMFTSEKVVTHPGQAMFHSPKPVNSLHLTWRFAQSADPNLFTRELHFRALLITDENPTSHELERDCKIKYQYYDPVEANRCVNPTTPAPSASGVPAPAPTCAYSKRKGKVGWNAQYTILHPTEKTIGAWDYFHRGFVKRMDVKCHADLSEGYYKKEDNPTYGDVVSKLSGKSCQLNGQFKISEIDTGPQHITGALTGMYNWLSWTKMAQMYFGVPDIQAMPITARPEPNARSTTAVDTPAILHELLNLPKEESLIEEERCYCPRLGTKPPEKTRHIPKKLQLEARKDHAINMSLAWIILVPLAIFVSRYYKETYSKVFFLQEYWWFTIHFLSLVLACVFMLGGIYGIEVKRLEKFFVDDPALLAHIILGGVAVCLFVLHLLLGAFRFRNVAARKVLIFLHWLFGVLEFLLALAAMFSAGWVPAGCFSCGFFVVALVFVVGQIIFFAIMEIHFRRVDKKLKLRPKRRYLPPPVMRVFHINAPGSKFRIYMLCGYVVFCLICYIVAHVFIAVTPYYGSCFDEDIEDTEDRIKIEEIDTILQEEQDLQALMSSTPHGHHGHHGP